jgi:hypothetical protein
MYGNIADTTKVVNIEKKGKHLNTQYHICRMSKNGLHMNDAYIKVEALQEVNTRYGLKFLRAASCCVRYYNLFGGAVNRNNGLKSFYFLILFLYTTTCFGPSGGIIAAMDPFLGYTIHTYICFSFLLCYTLLLYLKLLIMY